jgi:hypothetical protein
MFGGAAGQGTLRLIHGGQEGSVVLNQQTFVVACAESSTGIAALAKMLGWEDGEFEFSSRIESVFDGDVGMPLDQALREVRALQSPSVMTRRPKPSARSTSPPESLPSHAKLRVNFRLLDQQSNELTKTEEAVIDLAIVGMPVGKVMDVIPESRNDILVAIASLREIGLIDLDS